MVMLMVMFFPDMMSAPTTMTHGWDMKESNSSEVQASLASRNQLASAGLMV